MLKLERPPKPVQLTDALQQQLTEKYKNNKQMRVWNKDFIKKELLSLSHNKCCYCEKYIGTGYADMHIDHFRPKSIYPDEVVCWDNLMPSCGDCNESKSDYDTGRESIINPCSDDPKDFFYLKNFRYRSYDTNRDSIANLTIDVLSLNDLDKKCKKRYLIVSELLQKLDDITHYAHEHKFEISNNVRITNRIRNTCRDILKMCTPEAEYAAFTSTAVLNEQDFHLLKGILKEAGQWNSELDELEKESQKCLFGTSP